MQMACFYQLVYVSWLPLTQPDPETLCLNTETYKTLENYIKL